MGLLVKPLHVIILVEHVVMNLIVMVAPCHASGIVMVILVKPTHVHNYAHYVKNQDVVLFIMQKECVLGLKMNVKLPIVLTNATNVLLLMNAQIVKPPVNGVILIIVA